jgi:hypothetical protein
MKSKSHLSAGPGYLCELGASVVSLMISAELALFLHAPFGSAFLITSFTAIAYGSGHLARIGFVSHIILRTDRWLPTTGYRFWALFCTLATAILAWHLWFIRFSRTSLVPAHPNRRAREAFPSGSTAWHRRIARGHRAAPRRREEAVQGVIAAPGPAARSVATDHPSGRGVTSVHGWNDFRPPIGGRSQPFMNDARHRRRSRGAAFRPWPVGDLPGHEPPLDPRRERACQWRPTPGWNRSIEFRP